MTYKKIFENLTMSRWQKETKKWKQKLSKDGSYLSEELLCGRRYKLTLCSCFSTIRRMEVSSVQCKEVHEQNRMGFLYTELL